MQTQMHTEARVDGRFVQRVWTAARDEALRAEWQAGTKRDVVVDIVNLVEPDMAPLSLRAILNRVTKLDLKRPGSAASARRAIWTQERLGLLQRCWPDSSISWARLGEMLREADGAEYEFTVKQIVNKACALGMPRRATVAVKPPAPRSNRVLNERREEILRRLWEAGEKAAVIAAALNAAEPDMPRVTINSIRPQARKLGLKSRHVLTDFQKAAKARMAAAPPPAPKPRLPASWVRAEPAPEPVRLTPAEVAAAYEACIAKAQKIIRQRRSLANIEQETVMSIARKSGLDRFKRSFQSEQIVRVQIGIVRAQRHGVVA